jgi:TolA-binding protein
MGECEYNLQRFEEAILEYQKVISEYPKSNKMPDSLLKQGMAFAKLGDNESAKIVLNKLIKKYPKSPQAGVAKKKLVRIK